MLLVQQLWSAAAFSLKNRVGINDKTKMRLLLNSPSQSRSPNIIHSPNRLEISEELKMAAGLFRKIGDMYSGYIGSKPFNIDDPTTLECARTQMSTWDKELVLGVNQLHTISSNHSRDVGQAQFIDLEKRNNSVDFVSQLIEVYNALQLSEEQQLKQLSCSKSVMERLSLDNLEFRLYQALCDTLKFLGVKDTVCDSSEYKSDRKRSFMLRAFIETLLSSFTGVLKEKPKPGDRNSDNASVIADGVGDQLTDIIYSNYIASAKSYEDSLSLLTDAIGTSGSRPDASETGDDAAKQNEELQEEQRLKQISGSDAEHALRRGALQSWYYAGVSVLYAVALRGDISGGEVDRREGLELAIRYANRLISFNRIDLI